MLTHKTGSSWTSCCSHHTIVHIILKELFLRIVCVNLSFLLCTFTVHITIMMCGENMLAFQSYVKMPLVLKKNKTEFLVQINNKHTIIPHMLSLSRLQFRAVGELDVWNYTAITKSPAPKQRHKPFVFLFLL